MGRGSVAPLGSSPDTLRQTVNKGLGDANMQDRGIGLGVLRAGQDAGKLDAVYAEVTLNAAGLAHPVYDVAHTLGRAPGFVLLMNSENTTTPASHYSVIGWQRDKWNQTNLRIHVALVAGAFNGGRLTLLVGGER